MDDGILANVALLFSNTWIGRSSYISKPLFLKPSTLKFQTAPPSEQTALDLGPSIVAAVAKAFATSTPGLCFWGFLFLDFAADAGSGLTACSCQGQRVTM